jgi:hypothetical protein
MTDPAPWRGITPALFAERQHNRAARGLPPETYNGPKLRRPDPTDLRRIQCGWCGTVASTYHYCQLDETVIGEKPAMSEPHETPWDEVPFSPEEARRDAAVDRAVRLVAPMLAAWQFNEQPSMASAKEIADRAVMLTTYVARQLEEYSQFGIRSDLP